MDRLDKEYSMAARRFSPVTKYVYICGLKKNQYSQWQIINLQSRESAPTTGGATVTARTSIKKILTSTDKKEAQAMLPKVHSLLDRLAKRHIIHKNKAANLKSELAVHVGKLK